MEERVRQLETQVAALASTVAHLEIELRELRGLAPGPQSPAVPAREAESSSTPTQVNESGAIEPPAWVESITPGLASTSLPTVGEAGSAVQVLSLLGQSFLGLGGAFLIRAVTDEGLLRPGLGVGLGLVFALLWTVGSDRALARKAVMVAGFRAVTSAVIAYPLLWETTSRLGLMSPWMACTILVGFTALALVSARRHEVLFLAWIAEVAALLTLVGLLIATPAIGAPSAGLVCLLGLTLSLEGPPGWTGLRWPIALITDVVLWRLAHSVGDGPEADVGFTLGIALLLGLVAIQIGHLTLRTLWSRRSVGPFEGIQVPLALAAGLGGSVHVVVGHGGTPLFAGLIGLAAAPGAYLLAGRATRGPAHSDRDFYFFASLAVALILGCSGWVAGPDAVAIAWSLLGLLSVALGERFRVTPAWLQGTIYLWAGALESGLIVGSARGFAGASSLRIPAGAWAVLGLAMVAGGWMFRHAEASRQGRWIRAALALLVVGSLDGLAACGAMNLLGDDTVAGPALRSVILAATALGLGAVRRVASLPELGWLSALALILGGGKLLIDDLPNGHASMLVLAFSVYGLALILVSRLTRVARPS